MIQDCILLWMDELKTVTENNETTSLSDNKYYYWFRYDRIKKIIPMNPLEIL